MSLVDVLTRRREKKYAVHKVIVSLIKNVLFHLLDLLMKLESRNRKGETLAEF